MKSEYGTVNIGAKEYEVGNSLPRPYISIQIGDDTLRFKILKGNKKETQKKEIHGGKKGIRRPKNGEDDSLYLVAPSCPPPPNAFPFVPDLQNPRKLFYNPTHETISVLFSQSCLNKTDPIYEAICDLYKICANVSLKSRGLMLKMIDANKANASFKTNLLDKDVNSFSNPLIYHQAINIRMVMESPQIKKILNRTCKYILEGKKNTKEAVEIAHVSKEVMFSELTENDLAELCFVDDIVDPS